MLTSYRIVTTSADRRLITTDLPDRAALDAWVAERGLAVVGEKRQRGAIAPAPEVLGQPFIRGLNGPMKEADGVCRYEDWPAFDLLST
jgi:ABC-type transport system involved in Fe-S cluster assembly fused permease/ATPase subunit